MIPCNAEAHGDAVLEIFNDAIANTTASYDERLHTEESIRRWFDAKQGAGCPVIAAIDTTSGELLGFAAYGPFRTQSGYRLTVEHSVYVHQRQRGKGLGRALLQRLLELARAQGLHLMVGVIDMANQPSIALHAQLGFSHAGTLRQAGAKFGRWLDVGFFQYLLDQDEAPRPAPANP
ncbi:N-acetyltransferase family protein [Corticibacter populi]|uniref:N-acetyltransferase family protein n=1 Tax=Corticibacter populi TaxID=1550736 RepID=A0A3M6QSM0_9BURK|nr:N-acetyltransferase family protein [Corticibacter populi]